MLDQLEARGLDVEPFRKSMIGWTNSALCFPDGWKGTQPNSSVFTPHLMDNLRNLVTLLDAQFPGLKSLDTAPLQSKLDEVQSELAHDTSLPDDLKAYIHAVVNEARTAVADFNVLGSVDLMAAMKRLEVALYAAAHKAKGAEAKKRWAGRAADFGYGALVNAAGQIAATPVVMQISEHVANH